MLTKCAWITVSATYELFPSTQIEVHKTGEVATFLNLEPLLILIFCTTTTGFLARASASS